MATDASRPIRQSGTNVEAWSPCNQRRSLAGTSPRNSCYTRSTRFTASVVLAVFAMGCSPNTSTPKPADPTPKPSEAELTEAFRILGAPDPESWASSQSSQGIPQLERYLFLRESWRGIVAEEDHAWIGRSIRLAQRDPDAPLAGAGLALSRMKALGVSDEDINALVRAKQYESVFDVLYAMDNPPEDTRGVPLAEAVHWGLFRCNPDTDEPVSPAVSIDGLYESLLETDPTGREMRPRK